MTFEHVVCPHCGCHCEDDEFCAACGRLFHEDEINAASRKVSLLGFFGGGLHSLSRSIKPMDDDELEIKEDLEFDSSWSSLSSNVYNDRR